MKKQLLFVTYRNEGMNEGLTYAIDLAKTLDEGITILLLNLRRFGQKIEDIMAAAAFAEEGEHETAKEIESGNIGNGYERQTKAMLDQCKTSGIDASMQTAQDDLVSSISDLLKKKIPVDMVLLGPSVMKKGNFSARELRRLVRTTSRPVVTIAKQELQHA